MLSSRESNSARVLVGIERGGHFAALEAPAGNNASPDSHGQDTLHTVSLDVGRTERVQSPLPADATELQIALIAAPTTPNGRTCNDPAPKRPGDPGIYPAVAEAHLTAPR